VTAAISVFLALLNPKANKLCWLLHLGWNLPESLRPESIRIKRKAIEWPISSVPEKSLQGLMQPTPQKLRNFG
jgi:hypothetical protein